MPYVLSALTAIGVWAIINSIVDAPAQGATAIACMAVAFVTYKIAES